MKNLVTCLFLLGCLLNASAENLIYPPENAEQEAWIMTYNQYDYQNYHPILDSKKRNVKIVRDQDQMYIMGIFPEFRVKPKSRCIDFGKSVKFAA